jgi:hypothetical protein
MTSQAIKWLDNKTSGYNAMIMVKFSSKSRTLLYPAVLIKLPDKFFTQDTRHQ